MHVPTSITYGGIQFAVREDASRFAEAGDRAIAVSPGTVWVNPRADVQDQLIGLLSVLLHIAARKASGGTTEYGEPFNLPAENVVRLLVANPDLIDSFALLADEPGAYDDVIAEARRQVGLR